MIGHILRSSLGYLGMMHMRKRVKHTIMRYSLPSVEVGIPTLAEAYELGK